MIKPERIANYLLTSSLSLVSIVSLISSAALKSTIDPSTVGKFKFTSSVWIDNSGKSSIS